MLQLVDIIMNCTAASQHVNVLLCTSLSYWPNFMYVTANRYFFYQEVYILINFAI